VSAQKARRAQSGVALIAVLWLLVILGVLSSALLKSTHFDVLATSNERCRLQASYAAQAGVADATEQLNRWVAVAQVAARGGTPAAGLLPAAAGASEPGLLLQFERPLGDGRYRVVAVDVNSRINVNLATEQMLTTLLEEAGRPVNEAEGLAQAILDWIDGDDLRRAQGAEAVEYRRLGLDHLPRNGPIATLEELLHVRGMTREILYGSAGDRRALVRRSSGIAEWLTVQGSGRINLNTAPPEVLAALPGFTPAVVAVVLDLRQRRWIWSISDVAADPRLGGGAAPSLEAVARQLIRFTAQGLGTEAAWVRSQGVVSGCPVAADVEALLVYGTGVASWREGLAAGVH
jgi:general secretion pathway protein K